MEPRPKHGVKRMVSVNNGKTTRSTEHSGGRQVKPATKKGGSSVHAPIAPPRLKSRSGGSVIKSDYSKPKVKR